MLFQHFFQFLYEKIAEMAFFHIILWKNAVSAFLAFYIIKKTL
jgi:hypothetical protein